MKHRAKLMGTIWPIESDLLLAHIGPPPLMELAQIRGASLNPTESNCSMPQGLGPCQGKTCLTYIAGRCHFCHLVALNSPPRTCWHREASVAGVTREQQVHATSDQCSEELPGGYAADAILHEVPLAFQHHLVRPGDSETIPEVLSGAKLRLHVCSRRFVRREGPRTCRARRKSSALPAHPRPEPVNNFETLTVNI